MKLRKTIAIVAGLSLLLLLADFPSAEKPPEEKIPRWSPEDVANDPRFPVKVRRAASRGYSLHEIMMAAGPDQAMPDLSPGTEPSGSRTETLSSSYYRRADPRSLTRSPPPERYSLRRRARKGPGFYEETEGFFED